MTLVFIDERGRITLPKEIRQKGGRAIVIPAGSFAVVIPVSEPVEKGAYRWLKSKKERRELKTIAEERAREDAAGRAGRRRQI